jgi:hypothetical protein
MELTAGEHNFAVCDLQTFAKANELSDFISQYHAKKIPDSFKLASSGRGLREGKGVKKADVKVSLLNFL